MILWEVSTDNKKTRMAQRRCGFFFACVLLHAELLFDLGDHIGLK